MLSDTKPLCDAPSVEQPVLLQQPIDADNGTDIDDRKELVVDEDYLDNLRRRHGRTDLLPMPSDLDLDPLNWPRWRKEVILWTVALHAMQGPFTCAFIIPAFQEFATEFHLPLDTIAYQVSVGIIFLGVAPFIWTPISERYGRRPVYILSALVGAICTLAGAFCHSYGALMATRVFQAIFISPALSIGASTVNEMFFVHQKGQKMGIWVLMVTIGPCLGPVMFSYLIQDRGWRSSFFVVAAIQFFLFGMHLVFGAETMYPNRPAPGQSVSEKVIIDGPLIRTRTDQYWRFRRYNLVPFKFTEFVRPFFMGAKPIVFLAALANAITFTYSIVEMTIYVPELFGEIFHLTAGPIGLQFVALLIGAALGEQFAGRGGDWLMAWRTRKAGGNRVPEFRLGFLVPGFVLTIVGMIVWGVQLQNATIGKWNVTPDIGAAIAMFGMQLVASVCTTYAIESYPADALDVSTYVSFVRQLYAFLAPFYLGLGFDSLGPARMSGLLSGLVAVAMCMMLLCQIYGPRLRGISP